MNARLALEFIIYLYTPVLEYYLILYILGKEVRAHVHDASHTRANYFQLNSKFFKEP